MNDSFIFAFISATLITGLIFILWILYEFIKWKQYICPVCFEEPKDICNFYERHVLDNDNK